MEVKHEYALAFVTVCILIYLYLRRNVNYWSKRGVPGPKPIPIFGNILDNFRNPVNFVELERYKKYGRIYGFFEFSQPVLTVGEPELIKQITVKDFPIFANHVNQVPSDPVFSKNIMTLQNEEWKRVRAITSRTFTTGKLKRMIPLIEVCMKNAIEKLETIANEKEVDLKNTLEAFTLDVIARCAFATITNCHKDPNNPFLLNAMEVVNFRKLRVLLINLVPKKLQKTLKLQIILEENLQFFQKALSEILQQRRKMKSDGKFKDFVQLLMDAEMRNEDVNELKVMFNSVGKNQNVIVDKNWEKKLSEEEILGTCFLFLIAGYETTATTLYYCTYSLASNPNIQQILFEEVKNYFEKYEKIDYDALNNLHYLDAVIHETLRMYPPLAHFDRVASADYKLADTGIVIPKGTIINLPFYAIHHDPEFYPEPEKFKPERFLPENRENLKPFTFLPFGVGPRICAGMKFALLELKIALLNIVYRFKFVKTEHTVETPKFNSKKIFLHCEPIFLRVESRRNVI